MVLGPINYAKSPCMQLESYQPNIVTVGIAHVSSCVVAHAALGSVVEVVALGAVVGVGPPTSIAVRV